MSYLYRNLFLHSAVFLLLATVVSCSGESTNTRVLLTVNGVPITEGEFRTQWAYECSFREIRGEGEENPNPFVKSGEEIKQEIFRKKLIPMAAVKARYGKKIPLLIKEMEAIKSKIKPDASNFAALAAKYSKDTNANDGGAWNTVTRYALYYPVSRLAFTAEPGEIVGPFISLVGCHLVYIQRKIEGMLATDDTLVASHILLPFEEERPDFLPTVVDQLVADARIELIDPAYDRYLPDHGKSEDSKTENP